MCVTCWRVRLGREQGLHYLSSVLLSWLGSDWKAQKPDFHGGSAPEGRELSLLHTAGTTLGFFRRRFPPSIMP